MPAGPEQVAEFVAVVSEKHSELIRFMRDTATRHLAEGKSILDQRGLNTEQRLAVYECELIKRGE